MPSSPQPGRADPERVQGILNVASLFEGRFSIDWLLQLMDMKPSLVLETLENAVKDGSLTKLDFSRFCFSDRDRQELFRKGLNPEERDFLQRKIADLLLTELPDNEEKAQQVAAYLLDSPNDLEQCRWLAKAGDIYLKSFKSGEALQCYLKVLNDLSCLTDPEVDPLFIETAVKFSRIADIQVDLRGILKRLKDALQRAERHQDIRSAALLQMHIAKNEWYRSNYAEAVRRFQKGWDLSQAIDDVKLRRSALTFSSFFHYWQGYFQEAVNIYEAEILGMEEAPRGRFQLMAASTIGYCYTVVGQTAHGLGMIHATSSQCFKKGDSFMAAFSSLAMAIALIDYQRFPEAMEQIRHAEREARKWPKSPLSGFCHLLSAYGYYHSENYKKSVQYLKKFLRLREQIEVSMWPYPYLLELCWAMECKLLPPVSGLSFIDELGHAKRSKNVFMIGIAHRFQAFLQQKNGAPRGTVYRSLRASEKWLSKSGHMVELFRTRLALFNQYLSDGREREAREVISSVSSQLSRMPLSLIPPDLRSLREEKPDVEYLVRNLSFLGDKVMDVQEQEALLHHLITTANQMIGAERGAVFLLDEEGPEGNYSLHAARNLTAEQIGDPSFAYARRAIRLVISSGLSTRQCQTELPSQPAGDPIRSLICMPLRLKGRLVGVLYHDNRMLLHAFQEQDLVQLKYFAGIIALTVENQMLHRELESIVEGSLEPLSAVTDKEIQYGIVGQSRVMQRVISNIEQVAVTDATVLILGETGVGKELVAKAIHEAGHRKKGPFVSVHCSALPDNLISTELFGHEKGAFTGALRRRIGRFELAAQGTLFMDEIGELPLETQIKILRVLQTREFERIGGSQTLRSDFRLVTATSRNLETEVEAGRFRADLFYRLNIFPIVVPPLRERKGDIPFLARHFLQVYSIRSGKRFKSFPDKEMEKLVNYDWPGNVRELENVIERGTILSQSNIFQVPGLAANTELSAIAPVMPEMTLENAERIHIIQTLEKARWKIRGSGGAAERLDIHPSTLYSRMKKLGISKDRRRLE